MIRPQKIGPGTEWSKLKGVPVACQWRTIVPLTTCECGRPLSTKLSEEAPARPPAPFPVKKRRAQLRIPFHKPHLSTQLHPTSIAITSTSKPKRDV